MAELHKRYDGWRRSHPLTVPPSLTDLRGYAHNHGHQTVGSLKSDFMGVAEHLQENHPGLADRSSTALLAYLSRRTIT